MTTLTQNYTVVLLFGELAQVHQTNATDEHAAGHRFTHHPQTGERYLNQEGRPDARVIAVFAGHHVNLITP